MNKITRKHAIGAIVRNSLRMQDNHFKSSLPHSEAIQLFKQSVELVEVETTSFCNRTCSFCPNSVIDRKSQKQSMPEITWNKILVGLQELDYSGTFVWSRYSEPLSEKRILERISEVRKAAPSCRITINSNGDYLTDSYLQQLERTGLNRLLVDIYIPDQETYDLDVARQYLEKFAQRINRTYKVVTTSPEIWCEIESSKIRLVAGVRNIASFKRIDMSDRGGLVPNARKAARVSPCYAPFKHLAIDWDGSVMICCQVRSDSPAHADAVVGKIGDKLGLVEAYVRLAAWRESLRTYGKKQTPCANCNVSEYESNLLTRTLSHLFTDTRSPLVAISTKVLHPLLENQRRF